MDHWNHASEMPNIDIIDELSLLQSSEEYIIRWYDDKEFPLGLRQPSAADSVNKKAEKESIVIWR